MCVCVCVCVPSDSAEGCLCVRTCESALGRVCMCVCIPSDSAESLHIAAGSNLSGEMPIRLRS